MFRNLEKFEAIARAIAASYPQRAAAVVEPSDPFDERNIHPDLPAKVRQLFDDGYYPEATFLAFKFLDKRVHKHSCISESGHKLMMAAFNASNPKIKLNPLVTTSEIDEQEGYRFIFAGGMQGIRNPRGHEHTIVDDPDICLDHLSFVFCFCGGWSRRVTSRLRSRVLFW